MSQNIDRTSKNYLHDLPPELDQAGKYAMREKAAATLPEHHAFGHMSDEWVAVRVRMLMHNDLWHEPICQAARDRIMRLSLEVERLRNALSQSVETVRRLSPEAPRPASTSGAIALVRDMLADKDAEIEQLRTTLRGVSSCATCEVCQGAALSALGSAVETAATPEFAPDSECIESDGCPTEGAVLKRFWRAHHQDIERFRYLTEDIADRVDRQRRNELLARMVVMSYSAACSDIDIAMSERAPLKASEPQLWYCSNCKSGNRVDFHHTSCPACGRLRPENGNG